MFALLDEIVTRERQAQRHQARRRHRDDAAQEAVPVQPVRVRADAAATTSTSSGGPRPRPTTTTTTSSARASPTRKRDCGSRTRPTACGSRRARTRSSPPSPGSSSGLIEWGLELREPTRLPARALLDVPRRGVPSRRHALDQRAGRGVHRVRPHRRLAAPRAGPARLRATSWPSSRARRPPRTASTSARSSPRTRRRSRSGCCSPPTPPVRASTCRPTATGWSTSTSRSTRRGSSSGSAGSTGTGRPRDPQVFHFVPDDGSSTYAADAEFMAPHREEGRQRRAGPRLGQPGDRRGDPGALRPASTGHDARPRASTRTR